MTAQRRPDFDAKKLTWLAEPPKRPWFRGDSFADADVVEVTAPGLRLAQDEAGGVAAWHHVVVFLDGHGCVRTPRAHYRQEPGDVLVLDDVHACEVVHPDGVRLVRWSLPSHLLAPFLPAGMDLPAHLGGSIAAIIGDYTRSLIQHGAALDPDVQSRLLAHLAALVGLALATRHDAQCAPPLTRRTALRERILAHVLARATDPGLNAARVAADLGISQRWLHAVLRDTGCPFSDLVTTHRLRVGRRLLADPASRHLSIAEIAFLSGFNDLSTFYRQFRNHFHTTPKMLRDGAEERPGGMG